MVSKICSNIRFGNWPSLVFLKVSYSRQSRWKVFGQNLLKIIFQKSSNDAQDIQELASNSEKSSGSNLNSRLKSGWVSGYQEVLYTMLKKRLKEKTKK